MTHSPPDFTQFPSAQRAAYLGAIASLTTADRQASAAEVEFLTRVAEATGLSEGDAQPVIDAALDPGSGSLRRSLDALKASDLRFSLVQDLISFAHSDGQYSDQEQARIGQIAVYLGVSEQQYNALRQYQQAAADGQDVNDPQFLEQSGLGSRLSQLGMPKGGGMLSGILATVLPMILQRVLASQGKPGRTGVPAGAAGGGLMDVLGQVMGGAGGPAQRDSSPNGGLMDVLAQVMGGMGGAPQQPSARSSGMGGLEQLLRVLGQPGARGGPPPQQTAAPPQGRSGYAAAADLIGGLLRQG